MKTVFLSVTVMALLALSVALVVLFVRESDINAGLLSSTYHDNKVADLSAWDRARQAFSKSEESAAPSNAAERRVVASSTVDAELKPPVHASRVSNSRVTPLVSYVLWNKDSDRVREQLLSLLPGKEARPVEAWVVESFADAWRLLPSLPSRFAVLVDPDSVLVAPDQHQKLARVPTHTDLVVVRSYCHQTRTLLPRVWKTFPHPSWTGTPWCNLIVRTKFVRSLEPQEPLEAAHLMRWLLAAANPREILWLSETHWTCSQAMTPEVDDALPRTEENVTVQLEGGLGNQMFQVATAMAYARDHDKRLCMDRTLRQVSPNASSPRPTYTDHTFRLVGPDHTRGRFNEYHEKRFNYDPVPHYYGNVRLHGYFQSCRYFHHHRAAIVKAFTAHNQVEYDLPGRAVSLHVRRGDYVNHSKHTSQTLAYYAAAITEAQEACPGAVFVVFSDDVAWCRRQLPRAFADQKFHFLAPEVCLTDEQEMLLMSQCEHHVIANSSFSWWGAYLDLKPEARTWAPAEWFSSEIDAWSDVYCPGWTVLSGVSSS